MNTMKSKTTPTGLPRPYNRYNLFFILEREYIVAIRGGSTDHPKNTDKIDDDIVNQFGNRAFEGLEIPPLPTKYRLLEFPRDWYVPKLKKKRAHRKTHGVASFQDLAKAIGSNWKTVDDETLQFVTTVEKMLKERHTEILKKGINASVKSAKPPVVARRSSLPNIVLDCEERKSHSLECISTDKKRIQAQQAGIMEQPDHCLGFQQEYRPKPSVRRSSFVDRNDNDTHVSENEYSPIGVRDQGSRRWSAPDFCSDTEPSQLFEQAVSSSSGHTTFSRSISNESRTLETPMQRNCIPNDNESGQRTSHAQDKEDEPQFFFCMQCSPSTSNANVDIVEGEYWTAPDELVMQDFGVDRTTPTYPVSRW